MSKGRIAVLVLCLAIILAFAIFLWGDAETRFDGWVFGNPFTPAILFFIFFGAIAGVLKILIEATIPNRVPVAESNRWEKTRTRGKLSFILNALLFFGIPVLVTLAIQAVYVSASGEVIRNFVVLAMVLFGAIAAITNAIWNYHESHYLKAVAEEKIQRDH